MSIYKRLANFDAVPGNSIRPRFSLTGSALKNILFANAKNAKKKLYGDCAYCDKRTCVRRDGNLYQHSSPGRKKCTGAGDKPSRIYTECLACQQEISYTTQTKIVCTHGSNGVICPYSGKVARISRTGTMTGINE